MDEDKLADEELELLLDEESIERSIEILAEEKREFDRKQVDTDDSGELLANESHRICPHCSGYKDRIELLAYYYKGEVIWSDFRSCMPKVATPSFIQKCTHCGKYYIIKVTHVLIKDTKEYELVDPISWEYFKQSYWDFSELAKDSDVEFNHRLRIMCAYNDEFNRYDNSPSPTAADYEIFKDNMLKLMEYYPPFVKAEFYRQIGMFDKCFEQLAITAPEDNQAFINTIANLAKEKDTKPFSWDV